jgi:transcription elongation GreA/GreB family factor
MEEYCPIDEKEVEDEKPLIFSEPESAVDETKSSSIDTFVEVGDQVTYCFAEVPNERHCVLIVDSPSNPKHNIINEHAPVAQALLGLSVGEENTLDLPSGKSRAIKVLKIQRQEEMFD